MAKEKFVPIFCRVVEILVRQSVITSDLEPDGKLIMNNLIYFCDRDCKFSQFAG